MPKKKNKLPMIRNQPRGRPSIDWIKLYNDYLNSSMSIQLFLESVGLDYKSQYVKSKTRMWVINAKIATNNVKEAIKQQVDEEKNTVFPHEIEDLWQIVQQWRKAQAKHDYQTADNIRVHIKILLKNAVIKKMVDGSEKIETSLRPSEIKVLTGALRDIQHIQRLALGMSTENIGIDKIENEPNVEIDDDIPTFLVEVGSSGKFERPRPKQIK